jgi:hypothetical protein
MMPARLRRNGFVRRWTGSVSRSPAKAGVQGSGNRCFVADWIPAFAGKH